MSLALLAALVALPLAPGPDPSPEQVVAEVAALAAEVPHYTWQIEGESPQGRPLGLLVATHRPADLASQFRLLVFARQHGDEASPARASLLWLRSNATQPGRFAQVAVLLVPTLNPDGAAVGRRGNGAGVDLNRDWLALTQPETRWADALVRRWQPHLVVDLHAFHAIRDGQRREADWLEYLQTGRAAQDQTAGWLLRETVAAQQRVGEPVRGLVIPPGRLANTLSHRALALRYHVPALLVEVGDGRADPGARVLDQLVRLCTARASVLKPRVDALWGGAPWQPPASWTPPVPPAPAVAPTSSAPVLPAPPAPPPWAAAVGLATILLATAKFRLDPADRPTGV